MRKAIIIILFVIGLGVFSYPIISNMLAAKVHQTAISDYQHTVVELDDKKKRELTEEGIAHNDKLADEPTEFIDPFANGSNNSGNKSYYDALSVDPLMGRLEIPGIGADLPVYHGTNDDVLAKGVGHLENSSLPLGNKGEHSVLTAHRGLPSSKLFRHVDDMTVGDEFTIQILDELLTYKVFEINIVLPDETDWLQNDERKSLVTLLSCEPYMIDTHRMLITGELVSKDKITEDNLQKKQHDVNGASNFLVYIIMAIALFSTITIIYHLISRREA